MPFGRDLPPSRLHRHRDCGEAAARIAWAVADKTICMVTGEVGTGKTAAIRAAAADLDPAAHTVIYIGNPSTGVRGINAHVVTALGGKPVHGTAALAVQAWNVLAGEAAERGRTPVLVIDEAHLLDHEQLESIRLMTNHDMDSSTPFATILVGQPTLRHSVKLGVLAALEQRITVRYQMKGMTPEETAGYIRHHLEQAGRTAELFTDEAIAQVHQAARGKPRTVNNIAVAALIATAGAGKNLVDHASARAAIAEVTATDLASPRHREHQAPPGTAGRGLHVTTALTSDDAATLTLNDRQHPGRPRVRHLALRQLHVDPAGVEPAQRTRRMPSLCRTRRTIARYEANIFSCADMPDHWLTRAAEFICRRAALPAAWGHGAAVRCRTGRRQPGRGTVAGRRPDGGAAARGHRGPAGMGGGGRAAGARADRDRQRPPRLRADAAKHAAVLAPG
jgi:type II secretory pathway predicted ATPase ExeA